MLEEPLSIADAMSAEEAAMTDDARIPFPQENDMLLGQEMISVFEAQVMFAFDVGSGEILKAVLAEKTHGIGVCKNVAHKTFVMDTLKEFVKTRGLVNMVADAP